MVATALAENRIMLTRDTGIMDRRIITSGKVRAILISSDRLAEQIQQVIETLEIDKNQFKPLTLVLSATNCLLPGPKAKLKTVSRLMFF